MSYNGHADHRCGKSFVFVFALVTGLTGLAVCADSDVTCIAL